VFLRFISASKLYVMFVLLNYWIAQL